MFGSISHHFLLVFSTLFFIYQPTLTYGAESCPISFKKIAKVEAAKVVSWIRPFKRAKVRKEIINELKKECPVMASCTSDQIQKAVAKVVEPYIIQNNSGIPSRAWALFIGGLTANAIAIPVILSHVPAGSKDQIGYFIAGFGGQILGAVGGIVMDRINANARRWAAQNGGDKPSNSVTAAYLRYIWQKMQSKFSNIERDARGVVSNLDNAVNQKLNSAVMLKSMGDEAGAVKMVAHTIKIFNSRYPEVEADDKHLAEVAQILLSFADKEFKNKVRNEVNTNNAEPIADTTLDKILDAWMPIGNS